MARTHKKDEREKERKREDLKIKKTTRKRESKNKESENKGSRRERRYKAIFSIEGILSRFFSSSFL